MMNRLKYILPLTYFLICLFPAYTQETPEEKGMKAITTDAIRAQLRFLASDWTEGREAGEKGEYLAGDYIASMLQVYGVKPAGDYIYRTGQSWPQKSGERSYFQNFTLIKTFPGSEHKLKFISGNGDETRTITFSPNVDFSVRPLFRSVEITAPVVFAGYAFKNEKTGFNDFRNTDIKGKFILKISGYPDFVEKILTPSEINSSAADLERYAREMGAAGIIEFNPEIFVAGKPEMKEFNNSSPSENYNLHRRFPARYSLPGKTFPEEMIRITISAGAAAEILKGSGISISGYMNKADENNKYVIPQLNGRSLSFVTSSVSSQVAVRNIIGIIEGNKSDEIIAIGAHYDHMGMEDGYIWNGADDNASGTTGILTLAKALTATGKKPDKTIVIALWSSEEVGLLGSRYFVRNHTFPEKSIRLNLNFDMISRYISGENKKGVDMTYTASYPIFKEITEENLKKFGIDLEVNYQPSDNPPGGSDHRSFVEAGIPVMRFKPGHREEYHTPYDEFKTIDWDIMEKIIRISFANIWELANSNW